MPISPDRKHIKDLTQSVIVFIRIMDAEMRLPSSEARGERVAMLVNQLDLDNDIAMRYGLGMSFPAIKRRKAEHAAK